MSELESQIDSFEAELEGLSVKKGKTRPPRLVSSENMHQYANALIPYLVMNHVICFVLPFQTHLETSITRHKEHIIKLELILRLLDNDELSPEQVNDVKDFLDDYVERNQVLYNLKYFDYMCFHIIVWVSNIMSALIFSWIMFNFSLWRMILTNSVMSRSSIARCH